jgi:C4-type Zn-finger protein
MTSSDKEYREWIECPECGGEGRCEYTVAVPDFGAPRGGELQGRMMDCATCGGSGDVLMVIEQEEDEEELLITVQLERAGSIH